MRQRLRFVELAGDDKHGVVGLVVASVKRLQPFDRYVLDIRAGADGAVTVVMPEKRGAHDAFAQNAARIVLAQLEFVADDGHFRLQVLRSHERMHHPIRFEIKRPREIGIGGRHRLEVVRAIEPGGAIRSCAPLCQFLRHVLVRRCALEKQMLEQVRHAGLAVPFMPRTNEVGDVDGDGRLGRVGEEQDTQAVGKAILGDPFHRSAFDGANRGRLRCGAGRLRTQRRGGNRQRRECYERSESN